MPSKPNLAYSWSQNRNTRDCYCNLPRFSHTLGTPHRIKKSRWCAHHAAWRSHNQLPKRSGIYPTTCTPGSERWMVYDEEEGEYIEVDVSLPGEKYRVSEETRRRFERRDMNDAQTGPRLNCAGDREVAERKTALFAVVIDLDRTLAGPNSSSAGGGQAGTGLFPIEIISDTEDRQRQKTMERRARRMERGERRNKRRARRRERDERRKAKDARRMERVERKRMVQGH